MRTIWILDFLEGASMSDVKRKGCLVRGLRIGAWVLGVLVGVTAILFGTLTLLAGNMEKKVHAAWAAEGLPLEGFLSGIPDHGDSDSARALMASAARLGLVLDTTGATPSMATPEAQEAWKRVKPMATELKALLESPELPAITVPEPLQAFLQEKAPVLEEIRTGLRTEPPLWRSDISKGYRAQMPPVIGQLDLGRLLLADALVALSQGNEALAVQDLEAIWRLSEGLVERPELIGPLVALAMRRMVVLALRHLEAPGPEWEARLAAFDPSRSILKAYQCEAVLMGTVAEEPRIGEIVSPSPGLLGGRFTTALVRPYLRLCCASGQEILLRQIQYVRASWPCLSPEALRQIKPPTDKVPSWNLLARIALPNLSPGWDRAKLVQIAGDMTRKVMRLKAAKRATGTWPASLPEPDKPFCANDQYDYAVTPGGAMTLTFRGAVPTMESTKDFNVPLAYRTR